jgi:hypothetical protein
MQGASRTFVGKIGLGMAKPQPNKLKSIDSVWMAVSVDADGIEGICGVLVGKQWMPLVAADEARLPFVREQAAIIARATRQLVRVIRLHGRSEVEVFDGS